jgi:UDP-3-O-[3-hydroxymyristoyl] glucosamine N-acyltransferase
MTYHLNHTQLSENRVSGKHVIVYDIEFILSELRIRYSIYSSKGDFDSTCIYNIKDIKNASSNDLTFCSLDDVEKAIMIISKCDAKVVLCHQLLEGLVYPKSGKQQSLIFVDNPRLAIMKIMNKIYYSPSINRRKRTRQNNKVAVASLTSIISKSARIGKNCSIGNFTKIGDKCIIGDNTVVGDRVNIEQNTRIGKNCIIQPGTVIGADGFAYENVFF